MTKKRLNKLIKRIDDGPISWDMRGDDDVAQEESRDAWEEIKRWISADVEPGLS